MMRIVGDRDRYGIVVAGIDIMMIGDMSMTYDPDRHQRRSIRLRGYDYAQAGAYFVTICTQDRHALFGGIAGGALLLNDAGRMVERWWDELNHKFPSAVFDTFVVMPDHIHGIIAITTPGGDTVAGGDTVVGGDTVAGDTVVGGYVNPPLRDDGIDIDAGDDHDANDAHNVNADPAAVSLSTIIQWFKIMTTTDYIRHVKQSGWIPFNRRVWQRNYYERIIRDERQLEATRRYIIENPVRWAGDRDNMDALLARMETKE